MAGQKTGHRPSRDRHLLGAVAALALVVALGPEVISSAISQTLNDRLAQGASQQSGQKARLLVDAREIVYDRENDKVEARGDVQLYYQGRVLEADRVTYDRETSRVFAEGNAKLTEANGNVIYSQRFELTDDFRDGFIDSLRVVSPDKQRITAARAERSDGETTVFERGTYSACEPCKDNPEKPPLWQVKASRIIAKNSEQMLYYEDARLEFFGLPLAYIPFFSSPDPSVTRKSGILAPRYSRSSATGLRFSLPIYWAPAPHYDVLWTPSALSRQGLLNELEWRHRLETGVYNIRASGIFQAEPRAYLPGPFGPNYATLAPNPTVPTYPFIYTTKDDKRTFRGSLESTGQFLINKNWKFGWDVALTTDKYFLTNYRVKSESLNGGYFKESLSSVYLRGQTERAYFEATGTYIQGLTQYDWQKRLPVVHPNIDYNRRFQLGGSIGGELSVDVNVTSLSREVADFVDLPRAVNGRRFRSTAAVPSTYFGGPNVLGFAIPGANGNASQLFSYQTGCTIYARGDCLLKGAAGVMNRASTVISWRRQFIDPLGQAWTPFVSAQFDVIANRLDTSSYSTDPYRVFGNTVFGNDKQNNFVSANQNAVRAMPSIGVEYRFPLVASTSNATHLFEPIAQIIASPNESRIGKLVNEDSQGLVFSDSNLFSLNRFSGYDRTEGGIRANVGAQYTMTLNNGGYLNALLGQSYHLAGRNSFASRGLFGTDLLNTGLNSGLDKSRSDYVGRFAFAPSQTLNFVARARFDDESLRVQRLELSATSTVGRLSTSILYARQEAQPDLGYVRRREGVLVSNGLSLQNNWSINSSVFFDLDRYIFDRDYQSLPNVAPKPFKNTPFRLSSYGFGIAYADECTIFSIQYSRSISDAVSQTTKLTSSAVVFRLELKHLGQVNYRLAGGNMPTQDQLR